MRRTSRAAFFFFVAVVVVVSVFVLPGLTCRNVSGQMCRSVRSPSGCSRVRKNRECSFRFKQSEGVEVREGGEEGEKKKEKRDRDRQERTGRQSSSHSCRGFFTC